MMQSRSPIVCPQCQQIDMMQKVNTAYASGTSTSTMSGTSIGVGVPLGKGAPVTVTPTRHSLQGTNQSQLSARLAPPARPGGPPMGQQMLVVLAGLLFALPCACCGSTALGADLPYLAIGVGPTTSSSTGLVYLGVAGLLVAGAVAAAVVIHRPKKKLHDARVADWQIAVAKWNELYYCARDDLVLDPALAVSFPSAAMGSYLVEFVQAYRQQTQPAVDVTPARPIAERPAVASVAASASQAQPVNVPILPQQSNAELLQEAINYLKSGQKTGAFLVAHDMLRNDPEDFQAWVILAQSTPDKQEAIRSLERALELKPDDEWIRKQLDKLRQ